MAEPTKLNIKVRRGDTRRHTLIVANASGAEDISGWSSLRMVIDTRRQPDDDSTEQEDIAGTFVSDGTDGQVFFSPSGTLAPGTYYYDAEAVDANAERLTFASGSYVVKQDIAKP